LQQPAPDLQPDGIDGGNDAVAAVFGRIGEVKTFEVSCQ